MCTPTYLQVTQGLDTLAKLEELPTRKEGIFVMPLDRISILSTYMCAGASTGTPDAHALVGCWKGAGDSGTQVCPICPHSSRYVVDDSASGAGAPKLCTEALAQLQVRYDAQSAALENIRKERLPGR